MQSVDITTIVFMSIFLHNFAAILSLKMVIRRVSDAVSDVPSATPSTSLLPTFVTSQVSTEQQASDPPTSHPSRASSFPSSFPSQAPSQLRYSDAPTENPSIVSFAPTPRQSDSSTSENPSSHPSASQTLLPSQAPSSSPSSWWSQEPSALPSYGATPSPSEEVLQIWTIKRNPDAFNPILTTGRREADSFFVNVQLEFLLGGTNAAELAVVGVYPAGKCDTNVNPVVFGIGNVVTEKEDWNSNKDVVYRAIAEIDELGNADSPNSVFWDSDSSRLRFCLQLSLVETAVNESSSEENSSDEDSSDSEEGSMPIAVKAGYRIDFDVGIEFEQGFTVSDAGAASLIIHDTFVADISYEIDYCLCDTSQQCFSDVPSFVVGEYVRLCIEVQDKDTVEVSEILDLTLEQEGTEVYRNAIAEGLPDFLTIVEYIDTDGVFDKAVVTTPLDTAFFLQGSSPVSLRGKVRLDHHRDDRNLLDTTSNSFSRTIESQAFNTTDVSEGSFDLSVRLSTQRNSSEAVKDAVAVTAAVLFLLAIAYVRSQGLKRHTRT